MGTCQSATKNGIETDFLLDKYMKFALVILVLILGIVGFLFIFIVEPVECYPYFNSTAAKYQDVEDFCWTVFKTYSYWVYKQTTIVFVDGPSNTTFVHMGIGANNTTTWFVYENNTYALYSGGSTMPHKTFILLLFCEALCMAIPWLCWYYFVSKELSLEIGACISHVDILTHSYKSYENGKLKEESINRDLENYMEYLSQLLFGKIRRFYIFFFIKCSVYFVLAVSWFTGFLLLISPSFDNPFPGRFNCFFDPIVPSDRYTFNGFQGILLEYRYAFVPCSLSASTVLYILWIIVLVILAIAIVLVIGYVVIFLLLPMRFHSTFMYSAVPGASDERLAESLQRQGNPRYYGLFSRFCYANQRSCANYGVSCALAKKYQLSRDKDTGLYYRRSPNHAPVMRKEQIERFRKSNSTNAKDNNESGASCFGKRENEKNSSNTSDQEKLLSYKNAERNVFVVDLDDFEKRKDLKPKQKDKTKLHSNNNTNKSKTTQVNWVAHGKGKKKKHKNKISNIIYPSNNHTIQTKPSPDEVNTSNEGKTNSIAGDSQLTGTNKHGTTASNTFGPNVMPTGHSGSQRQQKQGGRSSRTNHIDAAVDPVDAVMEHNNINKITPDNRSDRDINGFEHSGRKNTSSVHDTNGRDANNISSLLNDNEDAGQTKAFQKPKDRRRHNYGDIDHYNSQGYLTSDSEDEFGGVWGGAQFHFSKPFDPVPLYHFKDKNKNKRASKVWVP